MKNRKVFLQNVIKNDPETVYDFTTNLLEEMMYVPDFVALYEIVPYIEYLTLDNESIRAAVKDYLEGGETRDSIINKYGKIEDWNTSVVTDMSNLFEKSDFNEDISKWDVSNVNDMHMMFYEAEKFNQPIGNWDTSNVSYMEGMFLRAKSFNQSIGKWDTSKVTTMYAMFLEAFNFNKPIGEWNTSNVTNMRGMFCHVNMFNQPIGKWNTSKVNNMKSMFLRAKNFNLENAPWYHE